MSNKNDSQKKSKAKRFKIIDKKSHVITIDNMTSTYYSKPKED